ncbi:MAG: hypothetical protein ABR570_14375 [Burkholderiales bacterium]
MEWARLAVLLGAAMLVAALAPESHAAGSRFSRAPSGGGGGASVAPRAFHHSHSTVIVRGGFGFGWPGPYYWPGYYYGPAYYYPAPVYYAEPAPAAPPTAYWYYCAPLGAYYPYVQDCPVGWQLVAPHPY